MKKLLLIISTVLLLYSLQEYYNEPKEEKTSSITNETFTEANKPSPKEEKQNEKLESFLSMKNVKKDEWNVQKNPPYNNLYMKNASNTYVELASTEKEIVRLSVLGTEWESAIAKANELYKDVNEKYEFKESISFRKDGFQYTITQQKEFLKERPIIFADPYLYELYFDSFTGKLIGMSIMKPEALYYENAFGFKVKHIGQVPKMKDIPEILNPTLEESILFATNTIRKMYKQPLLTRNKEAQKVAQGHSQDMFTNDYFEHESKDGRNLGDRLKERDVSYRVAGENIALGYSNGVRVTVAWLNSEGHRKNLLEKKFNEIGIGVFGQYATQNFIRK